MKKWDEKWNEGLPPENMGWKTGVTFISDDVAEVVFCQNQRRGLVHRAINTKQTGTAKAKVVVVRGSSNSSNRSIEGWEEWEEREREEMEEKEKEIEPLDDTKC